MIMPGTKAVIDIDSFLFVRADRLRMYNATRYGQYVKELKRLNTNVTLRPYKPNWYEVLFECGRKFQLNATEIKLTCTIV